MKVKDFLTQFEGIDPEAEISFRTPDGCCGEYFDLGEPYVDHWKDHYKPTVTYCVVDFDGLDFLSSCIKSGAAKQRVQDCDKD